MLVFLGARAGIVPHPWIKVAATASILEMILLRVVGQKEAPPFCFFIAPRCWEARSVFVTIFLACW